MLLKSLISADVKAVKQFGKKKDLGKLDCTIEESIDEEESENMIRGSGPSSHGKFKFSSGLKLPGRRKPQRHKARDS